MNSRGVVVEEPISSELVLVDEVLAQRARGALPDPPWLLPVLAELELEEPTKAVVVEEPSGPTSVSEAAPAPRKARRIPIPALVVLLVVALVPLAYLLYRFLPRPQGPTLAARTEATTPLSTGSTTPAPTAQTPTATPRAKSKRKAAPTRRKARTKSKAATPATKRVPRSKPRPRALARRVFNWHRFPGAVYYQFYLQRGSKTVFQARTVLPTARLPAQLKVLPGIYRVLVRPAVPSDAGIILGAVILGKKVTV